MDGGSSSAQDDLARPLLSTPEFGPTPPEAEREPSEINLDDFYDARSIMTLSTTTRSVIPSVGPSPERSPVASTKPPPPSQSDKPKPPPSPSFYGKASALSTGMLFPSSRGVVDALPHPTKPCLLFADHDPLAAVSHICLLEKEVENSGGALPCGETSLFTVVHVCEPLALHADSGTRLLRKIGKRGTSSLELPVLLNEGSVFQEGRGPDVNVNGKWLSFSSCLLPEYIDDEIGKKNLLRPVDAVGLYNMKLFIQRHSMLPALFHNLLLEPSFERRTDHSRRLLDLLKQINTDMQAFEGPYLCGNQFTLADIYLFPVIERIVVVLSAYRGFWIPPALHNLVNWYDAVSERPSVRVATSNRTLESQNTYCYERIHRNEYLIEVYEPYARGEEQLFAELNERKGCPGVNVYRQEVEEDMRDRRMCEAKNCRTCVIS
ncbi:hypothetical protein ACHAWF_004332 [Thalassiosira exigua]